MIDILTSKVLDDAASTVTKTLDAARALRGGPPSALPPGGSPPGGSPPGMLPPGGPPPSPRSPDDHDPSTATRDMRLPDEIRRIVEPLFELCGWTFADAKVTDYAGIERHFTRATGGREACCVLHIPNWILEDGIPAHREAVIGLPFILPDGEPVVIFSFELNGLDLPFEQMVARWSKVKFVARFIEWRYIKKVVALESEQARADMFAGLLKITVVVARAGGGPALTPGDLQEIEQILARLAAFEEPAGRRNVVVISGLDMIVNDVDFTGPSAAAASRLVVKLIQYGNTDSGKHALRLLLDYIRIIPDLPLADGKAIDDLMDRCRLRP
jgi:hypothetical protein